MRVISARLSEASGSSGGALACLATFDASMMVIEVAAEGGAVGRAPIRKEFARQALWTAEAFVVGSDGRATRALWDEMHNAGRRDRYSKLPAECIAALDIALWDLKSAARGVPLYREIGGENVGIPVVRHVGARPSVSAARQIGRLVASELDARGTFMMSLELSKDYGVDEAGVKAASKSFAGLGGRGVLGVRIIEEASAKEIVRKVALLEQSADIAFVEVPAIGAPPEKFRIISEGVRAAVCNAPTLATAADFYPFLSNRALDIVQINLHLSGITGSLELADAAYAFELPVLISPSVDEVGAHIAGAMPYAMGLGVAEDTSGLTDGCLTATEEIGAGWRFAFKSQRSAGATS